MKPVDPSKFEPVECIRCNRPLFKQRFELNYLNRFDSPTGKPVYIAVQMWVCDHCDYVMPQAHELKEEDGCPMTTKTK